MVDSFAPRYSKPALFRRPQYAAAFADVLESDGSLMHKLRRITSLRHFVRRQTGPMGLDELCIARPESDTPTAIVKLKSFSVCEVVAYQLAHVLGVSVPRAFGIWTTAEIDLEEGDIARPFRIGIVVRFMRDLHHVSAESAVEHDASALAKALVLCAFHRDEWAEFCVSRGRLICIDLERIGPRIEPEELVGLPAHERYKSLRELCRTYTDHGRATVEEILKEAGKMGVEDLVRFHMQRFSLMSPDTLRKKIYLTNHPLAEMISAFSVVAFEKRRETIARIIA